MARGSALQSHLLMASQRLRRILELLRQDNLAAILMHLNGSFMEPLNWPTIAFVKVPGPFVYETIRPAFARQGGERRLVVGRPFIETMQRAGRFLLRAQSLPIAILTS